MDKVISKGDVIRTALSDNTIVLKVEAEDALLFDGSKFVVAHGVQNKDDYVFWAQGDYYDDLDDLAGDVFDRGEKRNSNIKEVILGLNEKQGKNSRVFITENSTEINIRTDSESETALEDDWELEP